MNQLTVGLIGNGSKSWIAGINYISSFLYSNSLLSQSQQQVLHLFLRKNLEDETDYEYIAQFAKSLKLYDYNYWQRFMHSCFLMQTFTEAMLCRRYIRDAKNNIPKLLIDTKCQIIYPANSLITICPPSIKKISWIPDFQYKYYPEYFSKITHRNYSVRKILRLSDLVIVSNEFSKKDVIKFFPKYRHKIRVLPFTMWLGPEWEPHDYETVIQKYHLSGKYLIFPSQFWVHKNHIRLFKAIDTLKKRNIPDIRLICTGHTNDFRKPSYMKDIYTYIETHQLQENIQILGLIPRNEQVQLLRGAAAVVQPSLFEGHSALLSEVTSLSKITFVSDIPMHRKQQTEKFVFFNPYDSLDLVEKLEYYWQDLSSGPDLQAEKLALKNYYFKLREFGNQFREICHSII